MATQYGWWTVTFSVDPDDATLEHVAELIEEGYREGQVVQYDDDEVMCTGWWSVSYNIEPTDDTMEYVAGLVRDGFREGQIIQQADELEEN